MNGVQGITLRGVEAVSVEVEVEIAGGLFSISIVGLPDAAVRESKERVRAALRFLGMAVRGRVAVNLAPADLPKEGAVLDLPIAIGIASAMGSLPSLPRGIFLGELALDGRLRPPLPAADRRAQVLPQKCPSDERGGPPARYPPHWRRVARVTPPHAAGPPPRD